MPTDEPEHEDGPAEDGLQASYDSLRHDIQRLLVERQKWSTLVRDRPVLTVRIAAQHWFSIFVSFHLAVGIAGATMILRGSQPVADLGIALVVGALFGTGAFLSQIWAHQAGKEAVWGDYVFLQDIEALNQRWLALEATADDREAASDSDDDG